MEKAVVCEYDGIKNLETAGKYNEATKDKKKESFENLEVKIKLI